MINKTFSIVIPVKGRLSFAEEAISSIYNQKNVDFSSIEVIVVEDKPYGQIIRNKLKKKFPGIKTHVNRFEEGPGGGRQTGLKETCGKYLVFLDSDDFLKPNFLSQMSKALEKDKKAKAAICFSDAVFENNFSIFLKIRLYILMIFRDIILLTTLFTNKCFVYKQAFYLCQISHIMFRREIIENFSFNYDYRYGGEDWDFFTKLLLKGEIKIVPTRLLKFRYSWGSTTYNQKQLLLKWKSYSLLASRLHNDFKKGILFRLFLLYIGLFKRI